jgi:hypothetical protein
MSDKPDLSTWLTKQQAADQIGVSTKAIERFTRAGKLEQRFRPQAGSPHVAVFHPEEVDQIASARRAAPAPFVLPAVPDVPTNGNGRNGDQVGSHALAIATPPSIGSGEELLHAFAAALRTMFETSQTLTLFVTIREASLATGLTQAYLRRRCENGTLKAEKDRGWKIRRKDLEQL